MMGGNLPKMTLIRFNMGWWRCLSKPQLEHIMLLIWWRLKSSCSAHRNIPLMNPIELPCPQTIWKMWILQSIHSYIIYHVCLVDVFWFTSRSCRDHIHPTYSSHLFLEPSINQQSWLHRNKLFKKSYLSQPELKKGTLLVRGPPQQIPYLSLVNLEFVHPDCKLKSPGVEVNDLLLTAALTALNTQWQRASRPERGGVCWRDAFVDALFVFKCEYICILIYILLLILHIRLGIHICMYLGKLSYGRVSLV